METYGHLERLNNAIQTSSLKMLDAETSELIKIIVKNSNVKSDEVVVSLPTFSAFSTLIEVPEMSAEDTGKAMKFQAKQYIPLPISSVTIDWVKVGEKNLKTGRLFSRFCLFPFRMSTFRNIKIFSGMPD